MKKSTKWAALSAGAIGLIAIPLIAISAPGDCGFGAKAGGMQGQGMSGGMMQKAGWGRHGPERMLGKIESYKKDLNLTSEQEPAWNTFVGTLKEEMKGASRMRQAQFEEKIDSPSQSAIDVADERLKMMGSGLARMTSLSNAFKEFYAKLDSDQQTKVDELVASRGGMGRHRGF